MKCPKCGNEAKIVDTHIKAHQNSDVRISASYQCQCIGKEKLEEFNFKKDEEIKLNNLKKNISRIKNI